MSLSFATSSLNELDPSGRAARILAAALAAVDPARVVSSALDLEEDRLVVAGREYDLRRYRRILVVGVGKASPRMAAGLVRVLGSRLHAGALVCKHLPASGLGLPADLHFYQGEHPVPGSGSLAGARAVSALLETARQDDLVICLVSGGGSALMTLPREGISLVDLQELTRLLLASGADIGEMNTLRKHLDLVKGGGLGRLAFPAEMITLILSDIIGSPLDRIASGPTVADPSTYADSMAILDKYSLRERVPAGILAVLSAGLRGGLPETLKPGDPAIARVHNVLVAGNEYAARAALVQAGREGFNPMLLTTSLRGEARHAGAVLAGILGQVAASGDPLARPACIVAGGETTVTLTGEGRGGRNQELALGAVAGLDGLQNVALITFATDGEDGPTDAAGAVVTGETLARARALGLSPDLALAANNSYLFFSVLGDLLQPGPTGTNVNDLAFLFAF